MAKNILSKNLKNLLERKGKTQTDMAKDLNLKESTVSSWVNAVKYPRRDKIELLADYFGVMPSDITEDKSTQQDTIAAHFDKEDLTDEEKQEVQDFINYLKSKRK
ncbi:MULTISPECIES: helix-turn-helix domain-containing protein [Staphylococcus]|uniref:helix-turn-helix domain-containing protein n=1 Tax=Staphylococcus TaxID=1279 RepID=UPI000657DE63|nr:MULTISPECIES: helix-turn-helix transcriptional regulator [Staphylococcus]PIS62206.1 XRE family transcriptional regulator [Corynebacterium striatum]CRV22961.1 putative transcriptional regulator [Streptococcus equi subsp. equi]MCE5131136.1 helix-turn-helix transcriptional regulator [Staphylococcus saprophyticus]MCT1652613.1 helix-turn-helix domain-containing protein [Staphylococcus saprophyticus]MDW3950114.1 helix-turn-helix transcriptional regulator [Staphylococcus saprophyticus]